MKRMFALTVILTILLVACHKETDRTRTAGYDLVVYATNTWSGGFLQEAAARFEQEHGRRVYVEPFANIARLRNRLLAERHHPVADVVVGLDNSWSDIFAADSLFAVARPREFSAIPQHLVFDATWRQIPLSQSWLAFIYDSRSVHEPPLTMGQMTISNPLTPYIIVNPDSTTLGRAMFCWTTGYFGYSGFDKFWGSMRGNVLTMENDWERAYHRFLAGEASFVLGHATRPCYHVTSEASHRYRAFIPMEGGYRHIEGMAMLKGCRHKAAAQEFIDYCLTAEVQAMLPTSQWTLPVREGVQAPPCFGEAPMAEIDYGLPEAQGRVKPWLDRLWREWRKAME